jgi:SAM-dependent methyltransferase
LSIDFLKKTTTMTKFDENPSKSVNCPICDSLLEKKGSPIFIEDIFKNWSSLHQFSAQTMREHLLQSQSTELHACPNCLLEIFLPAVIGTERFYRELQEDAQSGYYRKDKWDFSRALKDVGAGDNIIEIGCGPGNFLYHAKPRAGRACGIEINKTAVEAARSRGLEVFGPEDGLDLQASSFDAGFSFHVLEHVPEPLALLKKLSDFVKPEGKICVSVPNQDGILRYIDYAVMNMPPHHATRWHLRTLQAAAAKLDLKITKIAYEPLLLENHNYYSHYWLNKVFHDNKYFQRKIKCALSIFMKKFFGLLMRTGFKHFVLLRGQAIYVVMKKK